MQLIDRRIGFIFAVFLALLAIGATKAAWLGVVKADSLQRAASVQQEADITIPAQRGSIEDANGIDLGVSEPAMDIAATPRLVTDATKAAAKLAPIIDRDEGKILRPLARRDTGFVYLGRGIPAEKAKQAAKLKIPGLEFIPRLPARVPAGLDGFAAARQRRHRRQRPRRARVHVREAAPRHRRRAPAGQGRDGRGARDPRHQAGRAGRERTLTLDANLQDQAEEVLAEVG